MGVTVKAAVFIANGLSGGVLSKLGGLLFDDIFPSDEMQNYFDRAVGEIKADIHEENVEIMLHSCNARLNGIREGVRYSYPRKLERAESAQDILDFLDGLIKDARGITDDLAETADRMSAGASVYALAVSMKFALLQEYAVQAARGPAGDNPSRIEPENEETALREIRETAPQHAGKYFETVDRLAAKAFRAVDIDQRGVIVNGHVVFSLPPLVEPGKVHVPSAGELEQRRYIISKKFEEARRAEAERVFSEMGQVGKLGGITDRWKQLTEHPIFGDDICDPGTPEQHYHIHTYGHDRRFARGRSWVTAKGYTLSFDDDGALRLSSPSGAEPIVLIPANDAAVELRLCKDGIIASYDRDENLLHRMQDGAGYDPDPGRVSQGMPLRFVFENNGNLDCWADPQDGSPQVYVFSLETGDF